jgi:zinc transporter
MNVGGIPFAENRFGFAIVVIAIVATTGIIAYFAFGRQRD